MLYLISFIIIIIMSSKSKIQLKLEQIKDILPSDKNLQILFEVTKKIKEQNDFLLCKIADQTGTSDAYFINPIKKYIEQEKVYLAKNAVAVLVQDSIRIELDKQFGTISKQPVIMYFKDNTWDLSFKKWQKKIVEKKIQQEPIKILQKSYKIPQKQTQNKSLLSKKRSPYMETQQQDITKQNYKNRDEDKKTYTSDKQPYKQQLYTSNKQPYKQQSYTSNKQPYKQQSYTSNKQPYKQQSYTSNKQPYKQQSYTSNKQPYKQQSNKQPYKQQSYTSNKQPYKQQSSYINKHQKNYRTRQPKFINQLKQLIEEKQNFNYSVIVYLSKGQIVQNNGKRFYEADLSDQSGTVFGSFFLSKKIIQNDQKYQLINMQLRSTRDGKIYLYETPQTEINFYNGIKKKNESIIKKKRQNKY